LSIRRSWLTECRLVGGTPIFLIDLIGANATLGFTPNYNSRKRSVEMTEELARMKRAVLETRRTQSTGQNPSSGLPSLLNLFCQLTHYTGPGCTSRGSNTFNKVPIIGNLYEADYIPRK